MVAAVDAAGDGAVAAGVEGVDLVEARLDYLQPCPHDIVFVWMHEIVPSTIKRIPIRFAYN
jgi:hypothetical protein